MVINVEQLNTVFEKSSPSIAIVYDEDGQRLIKFNKSVKKETVDFLKGMPQGIYKVELRASVQSQESSNSVFNYTVDTRDKASDKEPVKQSVNADPEEKSRLAREDERLKAREKEIKKWEEDLRAREKQIETPAGKIAHLGNTVVMNMLYNLQNGNMGAMGKAASVQGNDESIHHDTEESERNAEQKTDDQRIKELNEAAEKAIQALGEEDFKFLAYKLYNEPETVKMLKEFYIKK